MMLTSKIRQFKLKIYTLLIMKATYLSHIVESALNRHQVSVMTLKQSYVHIELQLSAWSTSFNQYWIEWTSIQRYDVESVSI